jgi:2-methylisocitrate lyase-like PEP mutase family enzyme
MDASKQKSLGAAFLAQPASPHGDDPIIVRPNAWDVASALLLARAGFKAIANTSAGVGYTGGYQVGEVMPLDEMLDEIGVRRVTVGAIMARATYHTLKQAANELRDSRTFGFAEGVMSHADLNRLMKGT